MPPSCNKRGSGYSQVEINSLFDLLEMHLPISSMEWERVEALHEINFPAEDRTRESLKRKFQDLYCTKIPTGNPFIPNDVRRAKEIQRMREERIHSSDCEGNQDIKNITHNAETKKDHDKNSSSTTDSCMVTLVTIESPTVASLNSAKPLVKVPFFSLTGNLRRTQTKMTFKASRTFQTLVAPMPTG